ncbi:NUDIX hydrolase [Halosimplex halophilum]|uniref:NUDIX hydrolase n=1 Tax=Halosimplex halophilum TaxID=2559572 RepID=UPI00107FCEC6|nr:NUDIX domain-containing protein [Halosimplex halophilum]
MTNKPPEYCPHCGGELAAVDPPTAHRCEDCEEFAFYNPTPAARVAVVDGDELLLCEVGVPGVANTWETPGGRLEADEDPPVAAARELREETGLTVDPDALVMFDARSYESVPDQYTTRLCYAVDRAATEGQLRAGAEPDGVRFWSADSFADSGATLSDRQPAATREVSWWLEGARAALDES